MSNEEIYGPEELRMNQGQTTGISPPNGGTSGFEFDEFVSNNATHLPASSTKRSRSMLEFDLGDHPFVNDNAVHQQERSLSVAIPQIFPSFVQGELERDFQTPEHSSLFHVSQNTLQPEMFYQLGNMEMGANNGSYFPIASPTAQGTVTSLVNGYHYPTSNFTAQLHGDSSSTLKLSPTQESSPQNQRVAANGAPAPCFPTTQWTRYPNLQKPHSQLSTGLRAIPEIMQFGGLSSFESRSSNTPKQHGPRGKICPIPSPREMGEPSSRNVKMKMTSSDNKPSTELHVGSFNPIAQSNVNPQPPRIVRNSLYDPIYEKRGLPVDPILRTFLMGQEAYRM